MTQRPKRGDIARERTTFAGRVSELDDFRQNLNRPANERSLIWMVYGQGGIGKTSLLNRYRSMVTSQPYNYLTAWLNEYLPENVISVMGAIAEQLEKQDSPLKTFNERYRVYRQRKSEIDADPERPKGIAAHMGRKITEAGVEGIKQVPVVGGVVATLGGDWISEKGGEFADFVARKLSGHKDDIQLVLEPEKVLTPLFVEDISQLAEKKPVILFFDTYEKTVSYLDKWLRDVLLGLHGDLALAVMLVIAGRYDLNAQWLHEQIRPFVQRVRLEPFTESEARDYLKQLKIENEAAVDIILRLSGGVPVLLTALASKTPDDPSQLGDLTGEAIDRFLQWVGEEDQKQAVLSCALPRSFNSDIVALLLGEEKEQAMFNFIKGQPFVSQRIESGWTYHDTVRKLMLRLRRQESPQRWRDMHSRLADYYLAEREKLALSLVDGLADDEWQQHNLNWLYHVLCAKGRAAVSEWLACVLNTFDPGSPIEYDRRLGETIREGGEALEENDLIDIGRKITDGMIGWNGEDYTAAQPMLNLVVENSKSFDADKQALALGMRALGAHFDHNYDSALVDLNKAVELAPQNDAWYNRRGNLYADIGEHEKALEDYTRAIALSPEIAVYYANRGSSYYNLDKLDLAIADFTQCIKLEPDNAENFNSRGVIYHEAERYENAIADYSRAIALAPKIALYYLNRAQSYGRLDKLDEALEEAGRAIAMDSSNADNYNHRGNIYYDAQRYPEALEDYSRAVELNPQRALFYSNRALAHRKLKRLSEALSDYGVALQFEPENPKHYNGRGHIYYDLDDHEKAVADYGRAAELSPKTALYYSNRGGSLRLLKRYDEALEDFNRAIALDPDKSDYYNERGVLYDNQNNYAAALEDYSRALERDASKIVYHGNRAGVYRALKRYDEALADYARALELEPDNDDYLNRRGNVHYEKGDFSAAAADYARAAALSPKTTVYYTNQGLACQQMGKLEDALHHYNRALELEPDNAALYNRRGTHYLNIQKYEEALRDYNRAVELDPKTALYYANRAYCYKLSFNREQAIGDYERALELEPENAHYHNYLGILYYEGGKYDQAKTYYDKAIALAPETVVFYTNRALNARWQGNYTQALADYDHVLTLDPDNAEYHNTRGTIYEENLQDPAAALRCYDRAIALDPQKAAYYANRAGAYVRMKKYPEALADYAQAIALEPNTALYYTLRADVYLRTDQRDSAIADLTQLITLEPYSETHYIKRGHIYRLQKDYTRAAADYSTAIERSMYSFYSISSYYFWRGQMHLALKAYDTALQDLSEALEKTFYRSPDLHFWRGIVHLLRGDVDAQKTDFQAAGSSKLTVLAKMALLNDDASTAQTHYQTLLDDAYSVDDLTAESDDLTLLADLLPDRDNIAPVLAWFTEKVNLKTVELGGEI